MQFTLNVSQFSQNLIKCEFRPIFFHLNHFDGKVALLPKFHLNSSGPVS